MDLEVRVFYFGLDDFWAPGVRIVMLSGMTVGS